jgi:ERCC4-related helicase
MGAAEALGGLRDPRAVPALVKLLSDPDREVGSPAYAALIMIGPPSIEELSEALVGENERAHSFAAGALERRLPFVELTGSTVDRTRVVDRFERREVDVFLISLKAGGTGLNLTSADTVIHYDPWWNGASQAQATDRAHRIGQTRPVFVHNLIVAGSVEERMLRLQQKKAELARALLGLSGAPSALSERDLDDLFAPLG